MYFSRSWREAFVDAYLERIVHQHMRDVRMANMPLYVNQHAFQSDSICDYFAQ